MTMLSDVYFASGTLSIASLGSNSSSIATWDAKEGLRNGVRGKQDLKCESILV
jgi:hypothetical protein